MEGRLISGAVMSTITVQNLNAYYSNTQILKDVNLTFNSGDFICLCGPNGCGKSTLMSLIGKVAPRDCKSEGKILLDDKEIKNYKPKELAQRIAFMSQSESIIWNFTVEEVVLMGRYAYTVNANYSNQDRNVVHNVLERLGIDQLSKKTIHQLSGGEFQKVRIARALAQQPSFIFLDEPSNNLDFVCEPELMELLLNYSKQDNIGVIISIHNINLAIRYAQKMILLPTAQAPLIGTPEELLTLENLEKTFKQKLQIYTHPVYNKIQIL